MTYEPHEELPDPSNDDQTVWRYLEFTQLMSILERESLWFTAADGFDDPYEGAFPTPTLEAAVEKGEAMGWNFDEEEFMMMIQSPTKTFVQDLFLNCWHINEYESAAMWDQYSLMESGIAIRSTIGRLKNAFEACDEYDVHLSPVEYIDFRDEDIREGFIPRRFLYKRKSYEHENELRAIIQLNEMMEVETSLAKEKGMPIANPELDKQPVPRVEPFASAAGEELPPGIYASINLEALIDKIFIAPDAPKWVKETVVDIAARYDDLNSNDVVMSSLKSDLLR